MTRGFKTLADIGGSPTLPDDGVMHRLSRLRIPQHRRLSLVGDANRSDLRNRVLRIGKNGG